MELELYKPKEYPVIVGNNESPTALCTLWQDPSKIASPEAKERFAIIGALRSPFGLNILLYNLALNPWIRQLVVWGPDKLSNTDVGLAGKRALLSLWDHGVDQGGKVRGSGYALLPEVNPDIANTVIKQVSLQDLSEHKTLPAIDPDKTGNGPLMYMDRIRFPEFKVSSPNVWPSEGLVFVIREMTGADAFSHLIDRIWKYGIETPIDTGGEAVKELRGAMVVIEREDYENIYLPPWLLNIPEVEISKEGLEGYYKSQLSPEPYRREIYPGVFRFERPPDYTYLYAELIYAFPRPAEIDAAARLLFDEAGYEAAKKFIVENRRVGGDVMQGILGSIDASDLNPSERLTVLLEAIIPHTDQIANVINRIRRKPDDLDKEVVLWDPRFHSTLEGGRPCLMKLSFSLRNGKLDVMAFFRSHDILGAWFFNYYSIARLLKDMARMTGCTPGRIAIESESAHLYQRHWNTVRKLLEEKSKKPPRMVFDVERDSDPRGNVVITAANEQIDLKLLSPEGDQVILEFQGRSALELLYRLKDVAPLSRNDHAAFVGAELAKAEAAIRLGIPYEQSQPLSLGEYIGSRSS